MKNQQAMRLSKLIAEKPRPAPGRAPFVLASGKGGVGKTQLAANLGIALARRGSRVLLVDFDLGLANLDIMLGLHPKSHIGHVIAGEKELADAVIEGPEGIKVLPAASGVSELASLPSEVQERFLRQLAELQDDVEAVVADAAAGLSDNVVEFLLAAERVLLVTTPDPAALADAYGVVKTLARRNGPEISIIVNRVRSVSEATRAFEKIRLASRRFLGREMHYLGEVPEDPLVERAGRDRKAFLVKYPGSKASRAVERLAANLADLAGQRARHGSDTPAAVR